MVGENFEILLEIKTSTDFEEKVTSMFPKLCIHSRSYEYGDLS